MADLKQTGIALTTGSDYQLAFTSDITSGILEVYQGTQLIYTTALIPLGSSGSLKDSIVITENVSMLLKNESLLIFSSITVSESITLAIV